MRSVIIHEKGRTFDPVIGSMAFPGSVSPDVEGVSILHALQGKAGDAATFKTAAFSAQSDQKAGVFQGVLFTIEIIGRPWSSGDKCFILIHLRSQAGQKCAPKVGILAGEVGGTGFFGWVRAANRSGRGLAYRHYARLDLNPLEAPLREIPWG
jgi:hypothetical protein